MKKSISGKVKDRDKLEDYRLSIYKKLQSWYHLSDKEAKEKMKKYRKKIVYLYNCNFEDCWCWYSYWNNYYNKYGYNYIYQKEDKHFIKKRYKNKRKRKYINFRNIRKKKKYEKYKSNKNNLNKYENEDIYEDLQENNYYYDKEEDESSYFY